MIYAFGYLISSVATPYLNFASKRTTLILGAIIQFIGLLLMGPSAILGIPPNLIIMGIGQVVCGLFLPLMLVPSLPEMIDTVDQLHPNLSGREKSVLYDFTSGIFNSALGLGQTLGPLYAAPVAAK
jgi:hypothetical protein